MAFKQLSELKAVENRIETYHKWYASGTIVDYDSYVELIHFHYGRRRFILRELLKQQLREFNHG